MAEDDEDDKPTVAIPATAVFDADGRILSAPIPAELLERIGEAERAGAKMDRARARIDRILMHQSGALPAIPPLPVKPEKIHTRSQRDRARRALISVELFPHGTDGIQPAAIVRTVQKAQEGESDRLGIPISDRRTIMRALAEIREKT